MAYNKSSAPKNCRVYGWHQEYDVGKMVPLPLDLRICGLKWRGLRSSLEIGGRALSLGGLTVMC